MSFPEPVYEIAIPAGASYRLGLQLTDESELPPVTIDLSGASIDLFARHPLGSELHWSTDTGEIATDPAEGGVVIEVHPDITGALALGAWRYDMWLTRANGDRVRILTGSLRVVRTERGAP